jgi:bifunctional UDP-N-acetylglucosamine pyrophosphorylase/glucosamine-1-phosphate N-acetyltransferase
MYTAVILAAGEGTRMRPLTLTRPKPMLPVAGKPILEWDLEALHDNKFKKVIIVVGYKKEKITEYFGKNFHQLKIEYVEQKEQLGTGHAVSLVKDKVGGEEEFFLMNGDLLVSKELVRNFMNDARKYKRKNLLGVVEVKNPSEFGIISLKRKGGENKVQKLVEKPKSSKEKLANSGVYIFNKKIFDAIEKIEKSTRAEYELTDAIKILIPDGIYGVGCKGRWIDIGRPWDLLDANEILMKGKKEKGLLKKENGVKVEKFAVIKEDVHLGRNTIIRSGAYIEGPCWIGKNCVIGPNCFIRPFSMIGDNCRIGNAVEVKNSIIMNNTNIGHLSYVGDSIIGENCNFGAGTKVANLRVDDEEVKLEIKNKLIKSGRRKFGCVMGDHVKTGINVSIMPGRAIYPGACVEAGSVVWNTIMPSEERSQ